MSSSDKTAETFANFSITKTINSRRSTILLARYLPSLKNYVLKVFPSDKTSSSLYIKEKEIHSRLHHPNVIKYLPSDRFSLSDPASCNTIFMEYAPYGDFFNLIVEHALNDEKLIRTYFHQLIDGLQHIHSKNIAHLDLKPENLLIGEGFTLKIADFDLSREARSGSMIVSGGTSNYRAPEVLFGRCTDYYAADIYSAGVCLYTLMVGAFPFSEERDGENPYLFRYDKFIHNNSEFWEENEVLAEGDKTFRQEFKDLINMMFKENPSERISLKDVKKSQWYNGPVYSKEELKTVMTNVLDL